MNPLLPLVLATVGALCGPAVWRVFRSVPLAALLATVPLVGLGLTVAFC